MTEMIASDILLLDISDITIIADYFVIATGETDRQRQALSEHILEKMEEAFAVRPLAVEGSASGGWLLLDYGSVIVHIFSPEQRDYYRLEDLWQAGKTIVRIA